MVLKLLRYARRARLPGSGWDQGLGSLASAQAGAPDQPPHDGDGDRAEGEIAAGQEEVEVGNPAPWLIAQGFHKVVLRRAVAVTRRGQRQPGRRDRDRTRLDRVLHRRRPTANTPPYQKENEMNASNTTQMTAEMITGSVTSADGTRIG